MAESENSLSRAVLVRVRTLADGPQWQVGAHLRRRKPGVQTPGYGAIAACPQPATRVVGAAAGLAGEKSPRGP